MMLERRAERLRITIPRAGVAAAAPRAMAAREVTGAGAAAAPQGHIATRGPKTQMPMSQDRGLPGRGARGAERG